MALILVDFDGTIAQTMEQLATLAWESVVWAYRQDPLPITEAAFRDAYYATSGRPFDWQVLMILRNDSERSTLAAQRFAVLKGAVTLAASPEPGAVEALTVLQARYGYQIQVVSSTVPPIVDLWLRDNIPAGIVRPPTTGSKRLQLAQALTRVRRNKALRPIFVGDSLYDRDLATHWNIPFQLYHRSTNPWTSLTIELSDSSRTAKP